MSKTEAHLKALKAIPAARWQDKLRKTLTGLVFVCLAVSGAAFKLLVAIIADGVSKAKGGQP